MGWFLLLLFLAVVIESAIEAAKKGSASRDCGGAARGRGADRCQARGRCHHCCCRYHGGQGERDEGGREAGGKARSQW